MKLEGICKMYKIGVVGPFISVNLIIEYAKEMQNEMVFIPHSYANMNEVINTVETHDHEIDFWLFSGYFPYSEALKSKVLKEKMEFVYTFGESVFQNVLEDSHERGTLPKGISIDSMRVEDTPLNMMRDFSKLFERYYVCEFEAYEDLNNLYEYHMDLWQQKKTDLAITTHPYVHQKLLEQGVKAFWMGPQKTEIYHSLLVLTEKVKTRYYKGTQATAIILQLNEYEQLKTLHSDNYTIGFLNVDIHRLLLELCTDVDGYLIENGIGRFTIFSTRGVVERKISNIFEMLNKIEIQLGCTLSVGIGSANTMFNADSFAHRALHQTEQSKGNQIVFMFDGEVKEYQSEETTRNYNLRSKNPEIISKLSETTISVKIFSKLEMLIEDEKWQTFIVKDIARGLKTSERNAQRIIAQLVKIDLIEHCGEEHRNVRGRSTKVYRLKELS